MSLLGIFNARHQPFFQCRLPALRILASGPGSSKSLLPRFHVHIPVLKDQVLEYLDPKPNENFVDCTIGQGGHTKLILEKI